MIPSQSGYSFADLLLLISALIHLVGELLKVPKV
jgi:hypothetical protein